MEQPLLPRPEGSKLRFATRMRIAGSLLLWFGEWILNAGEMVLFLLTRKRIRRRMERLIARSSLEEAARLGESELGKSVLGDVGNGEKR